MESIKVKQYKNDPRSFFTYLGLARAKEIAFQHTESADDEKMDDRKIKKGRWQKGRLFSFLPSSFLVSEPGLAKMLWPQAP